jgi:hypothetical protein
MKKDWMYVAGLSLIPLLLLYGLWRQYQLKREVRFTIGTTLRDIDVNKMYQCETVYWVHGKKITSNFPIDERKKIELHGGRYVVKFSVKHPDISKVFWLKKVPDSVRAIPSDGWSKKELLSKAWFRSTLNMQEVNEQNDFLD